MFTTAIGISLVSSFGGPIIIENADDFGPIVEAIRGAGSGLSVGVLYYLFLPMAPLLTLVTSPCYYHFYFSYLQA